jgi:hypothetical protein
VTVVYCYTEGKWNVVPTYSTFLVTLKDSECLWMVPNTFDEEGNSII